MRLSARLFSVFKYGLYSLLAVNILLFFRHATAHEALDSLGWLALLAVFELETGAGAPLSARARRAMAAVQAAALLLLFVCWFLFAYHAQWLDFTNATLWLLLVASLEADVRLPPAHPWRASPLHRASRLCIYGGLLSVAAWWGITADILNFYDAFLWIICYAFIELNLLRRWLPPC